MNAFASLRSIRNRAYAKKRVLHKARKEGDEPTDVMAMTKDELLRYLQANRSEDLL